MANDMILRLANQAVRVWERARGDIPAKIALGMMGSGLALLTGGGIATAVSISIATKDGRNYSIGLDLGGMGAVAMMLGTILTVLGAGMAFHRYRVLCKREEGHQAALIFFRGFPRMSNCSPLKALPKSEQASAVEVTPEQIDSYKPGAVVDAYSITDHVVKSRVYHGSVAKAYAAGLGSVPYLYLMGTVLRDGHLPHRILDHDRKANRWHLLDAIGVPRIPQFSLGDATGRSSILDSLRKLRAETIGVAISFTEHILASDLPEGLRDRTVSIQLKGHPSYDALRCEQVQEEITEKVAHFVNAVAKTTTEVHLFICAQASFVLRLGALYQDGMTGPVVIHNYDASKKSYTWGVRFDGKQPSRFEGNLVRLRRSQQELALRTFLKSEPWKYKKTIPNQLIERGRIWLAPNPAPHHSVM
jgi:hypothetical protein